MATTDIVEDSINLVYTYSAADLHGRVLAGKIKRWRRLWQTAPRAIQANKACAGRRPVSCGRLARLCPRLAN